MIRPVFSSALKTLIMSPIMRSSDVSVDLPVLNVVARMAVVRFGLVGGGRCGRCRQHQDSRGEKSLIDSHFTSP